MNIMEVNKRFNTKTKCVDYIEKIRWEESVLCLKCNSSKVLKNKKQVGRYYCYGCKTTFSVLKDTLFENTRLSLPKWFVIINLIVNAKKDISANEIKMKLGISYKTAWYCVMRVKVAMLDNCNMDLADIIKVIKVERKQKQRR